MSSGSEAEDKLSSDDCDEEESPTLLTIPTACSPSVTENKLGISNCGEESEGLLSEDEEEALFERALEIPLLAITSSKESGDIDALSTSSKRANLDDENRDLAVCTIPDVTSNAIGFEADAHQSWPPHVSLSSAPEAATRSRFTDMPSSRKDMSMRDPIASPTPLDVTLDPLLAKLQQWDITPIQSAPITPSTSNSKGNRGSQQEPSNSGPSQSKITKPKGGRAGKCKAKKVDTNDKDNPGPDDSKDAADASRFACPFAKRDPERYLGVDGPCTSRPGLEYKRVKEHVRKVHSMKMRCIFCKKEWTTADFKAAFVDHIRNNECVGPVEQRRKPEPMTVAQEEALDAQCNRRDRMNNQRGWTVLYQRLFPGWSLPPSPFYDFRWSEYDVGAWTRCDPYRDLRLELTESPRTSTNAVAPLPIQGSIDNFPSRGFGSTTYVPPPPTPGSGPFDRRDDPNLVTLPASVPSDQLTPSALFTQDVVTEPLPVASTESNLYVQTRQIQNSMLQMTSSAGSSMTQPGSTRRHDFPYGSAISSSVEGSDVSRMPTEDPPRHESVMPAHWHMPNANVSLLPPIINPSDGGSNMLQPDTTPFEMALDNMTALQTERLLDEQGDDWYPGF